METIVYTAAIVFIFGMIILFHEAGHFMVAKLSRIPVYEFALGLGPVLGSFTRRGTQYSIRAVPVGGFVRVAGMEPGEEDIPGGFNSKSIPVRIAVIVAGVTMNVILAVIIFVLIYSVVGIPDKMSTVAERVMRGKPAAVAGIKSGDKLLSVNGVGSDDVVKLREQIVQNPGKVIPVVIERDGRQLTLQIKPERTIVQDAELKDGKIVRAFKRPIGQIGITFRPATTKKLSFGEALTTGVGKTLETVAMIWHGLVVLFQGIIPAKDAVSGPVGIVSFMYQEAKVSWLNLLNFAGMFNVMIAFFNIIPFPALDGSRVMFLIVEAIRGRRMDPAKEEMVHRVGLVILLIFVLLVTVGDVWKLIRPE